MTYKNESTSKRKLEKSSCHEWSKAHKQHCPKFLVKISCKTFPNIHLKSVNKGQMLKSTRISKEKKEEESQSNLASLEKRHKFEEISLQVKAKKKSFLPQGGMAWIPCLPLKLSFRCFCCSTRHIYQHRY